jgi:hypothetical protein
MESCIVIGRIKSGLMIRESRVSLGFPFAKIQKALDQKERVWFRIDSTVEQCDPEGRRSEESDPHGSILLKMENPQTGC